MKNSCTARTTSFPTIFQHFLKNLPSKPSGPRAPFWFRPQTTSLTSLMLGSCINIWLSASLTNFGMYCRMDSESTLLSTEYRLEKKSIAVFQFLSTSPENHF
ncbi:unnamed protein product [Cuscuta epithymum]|uniref:Uncharacterized protein n=1 Tax=Cuscuta epithymum TaxID=186058 RepID=A0AAV0D7D3_9ASTE|nr:unnamed protein product [Cuscuta epithymum]